MFNPLNSFSKVIVIIISIQLTFHHRKFSDKILLSGMMSQENLVEVAFLGIGNEL